MIPVLDTNILIDYLRGIAAAKEELLRYSRAAISAISWMEVLAGAADEGEERVIRRFLSGFEIAETTEAIRELVIALRHRHRLRLADAVIWATAECRNTLLITRELKGFPAGHPSIRVPY